MIDRLDLLEKRYEEINNLLMQNEIISDVKKSRELSIELKAILTSFNSFNLFKNNKKLNFSKVISSLFK